MSIAFDKLSSPLLILYAINVCLFAIGCMHFKALKKTLFSNVISIYFIIYTIWYILSLIYNNNEVYVFKDSVGFLFYFIYPSLNYVLINYANETFYNKLILFIGILVSVIHLFVYLLFFMVVGGVRLTSDNLDMFNLMLSAQGFTADLNASGGMLRIDLGLGQLLIIPFAMLIRNVYCVKRLLSSIAQFSLALLLISGAVLDGHRSLLITMGLTVLFVTLFTCKYGKVSIRVIGKILFVMIFMTFTFLAMLSVFGLFDVFNYIDRLASLLSSNLATESEDLRLAQIPALLEKISERPFFGNGFGSYASILRSEERPFMYEVDYLAVIMKLGIIGTVLYLGSYITVLLKGVKAFGSNFYSAVPYVAAGISYLFYMGTNGGFAMSLFSTFFHLMVMLGIVNAKYCRNAPVGSSNLIVNSEQLT